MGYYRSHCCILVFYSAQVDRAGCSADNFYTSTKFSKFCDLVTVAWIASTTIICLSRCTVVKQRSFYPRLILCIDLAVLVRVKSATTLYAIYWLTLGLTVETQCKRGIQCMLRWAFSVWQSAIKLAVGECTVHAAARASCQLVNERRADVMHVRGVRLNRAADFRGGR